MGLQADTSDLMGLRTWGASAQRDRDDQAWLPPRLGPRLRLVNDEVDMPRIVVISTCKLVHFKLRRELSPRGFVVLTVEVGAGASRAVKDAAADVVLVDAGSTTPTGRFIVKSLKQDPAIKRTPVLFLDDRVPSADDRRQVLDDGADGVVSRSDDFDALAATLTMHLRR
jgi:DNA-binding response OmpR family regulator